MSQDLKKTLWESAKALWGTMDAAEYKHICLGLIFLKYISDSFDERREFLVSEFKNKKSDLYIPDESDYEAALEERDYYLMDNVFWVPEDARWEFIRDNGKQPNIGVLIDKALEAIEKENPKLKNILDKRFAKAQLEPGTLGRLIDLISSVGFGKGEHAKDVLGQVYEYFLGQFASAEGKRGGQFYTPASIVKTLVAILAPHKGRIYDPCCGSGGMFVQSEKFIESHGGKPSDLAVYGQERTPTTWRLAAMNLAIRGIGYDLGKEPADTLNNDQHPDLKADYILANPPFNISDWGSEALQGDKRWKYGLPPEGNANFAWLQHILHHLSPKGIAGVVLANGSMAANTGGEDQIRKAMVEGDVVEVMITLPKQMFFNAQVPACLWVLAKDKTKNGRDRRGETLFIDARKLGFMISRVNKVFADEDIQKIFDTVHAWRHDGETNIEYQDIPGFCKSASLEQIAEHDFILTPGRYVGAIDLDDDDESFAEKLDSLTAQLADELEKSSALDKVITGALGKIGYAL